MVLNIMTSLVTVGLLILCIEAIIRRGELLDAQFNDVKVDTKLLATVLATVKVDDVASCIGYCLLHELCKSINIYLQQNQCELLDGVFLNNADVASKQEAKGWVHYQYSKPLNSGCKTYEADTPHGPRKHEVCCAQHKAGEFCELLKVGYHETAAAISCKTIKEANPGAVSGLYWIDLGESVQVYCDMATDGGGWTLIGNITLVTGEDPNNYIFSASNDRDIKKIENAKNGKFLLNGESFAELRQYTNFDSFRIYCSKEYNDRTIDIVLFGDHTDYLTGNTTSRTNKCQQIRFLPDDTSVLQATNCDELSWPTGWSVKYRLYQFYIYKPGTSHIYLTVANRMECDDAYNLAGFDRNGKWYFFVR